MAFVEYLKKNFSMAKKTVFWDFSRYACFFVLLFLLQTLFSTVLILRVNGQESQLAYLESQYTNSQGYVYHAVLQGLSDDQYAYVLAAERAQAPKGADEDDENYYFAVVGGVEYTRHLSNGSTYRVYDLDIQFLKQNLRSCYRRFEESLFEELESMNGRTEFVCVQTPLLDAALDVSLQKVGTVLLILFLLVLSALMLWVLRSTLTAHYRFTYGIYLSFGATFGRLFMTAFFEMLILNVPLILPSALIGHLAAWLIHQRSGLPFRICPGMALLSPAVTIAASLIAVFVDFRRTASRPPVKLLASADNQDVISSPKTSADIFTKTFPVGVERLSQLRFRKYLIRLLSFALLFSVLSSGASYLSSLVRTVMDAPTPEYRLTFSPTITQIKVPVEETAPETETAPDSTSAPASAPGTDAGAGDENPPSGKPDSEGEEGKYVIQTVISYDSTFDGEIAEGISSMAGIGWIRKTCATSAAEINSHVLLPKNRVKRSAGGVAVGDEIGFLNAKFTVLDEDVARALAAEGVEIIGSLSDVLSDDGMIAVSENFNNARQFKLKVGDTVRIAYQHQPDSVESAPDVLLADSDDVLRQNLSDYRYLYRTYTVGAVIRGMATEGEFPVYLSGSAYTRLTGKEVAFTQADIILDENADPADLRFLDSELRRMQDVLPNLTVTDLDASVSKQISENQNLTSVLLYLAGVLLAASPLIWIFSQTLFYLRRRPEFRMYLSIGSEMSRVQKLFQWDGLFFALSGMGAYLLLSTGLTLLIHRLANNPYLFQLITGERTAFYFAYSFPWLTVLIGTLLMGICGWVSVRLAWRSFVKYSPKIFGGQGVAQRTRRRKKSDLLGKES